MKITILGRGNAGCLIALHYGHYTKKISDIKVELIYDKNIPTEIVGQGSLLTIPFLLWEALGIDWYNNPIQATPKLGILYENWGKKNEKIFHPFPFDRTALHYSPEKLQDTILKSNLFEVKEGHVDSYDELDSDYIFDCRGFPTNFDDYRELKNPLNAVLLGMKNEVDVSQFWTRTVATPDGWCFVIPNTTSTTSYGYLYNMDITTKEEASKNFKDLFGVDFTKEIKFKKYAANNPIIDNRIILGGNRLFFIEPLEATAIPTSLEWARYIYDWIVLKKFDADRAALKIKEHIFQIENFILWHYQFGSKYDTPFWDYAKTLTIEDPQFHRVLNHTLSAGDEWFSRENNTTQYGQWKSFNFHYWYDGVV